MELSFTTDLDENIAMMKRLFVHDDTFICREVRGQSALRAALFFFDGMVNSQAINESIVKPISLWTGNSLQMPDVIREVLQIDDCPFDLKTDQLLAAFLYGGAARSARGLYRSVHGKFGAHSPQAAHAQSML